MSVMYGHCSNYRCCAEFKSCFIQLLMFMARKQTPAVVYPGFLTDIVGKETHPWTHTMSVSHVRQLYKVKLITPQKKAT